ncbi:hypothetical protein [Streptosporangium sp. H16]|uniref:hypothetical protein n=1 Tax=Streptosporangium sp. H16 TaxID=3444184 RepID=UPI003F7A2501
MAWFDSRSTASVTAAHLLVGVVGHCYPFVDIYEPGRSGDREVMGKHRRSGVLRRRGHAPGAYERSLSIRAESGDIDPVRSYTAVREDLTGQLANVRAEHVEQLRRLRQEAADQLAAEQAPHG